MVLIQIYLARWLVASWDAYRQALGLSRWRYSGSNNAVLRVRLTSSCHR